MLPDDHQRAEVALEQCRDGSHSVDWPAAARRIRVARVATGVTEAEIATRLEMTVDSCADLQRYDDEVFTNVSLGQLAALGRALGVSVRVLLFGRAGVGDHRVGFEEIVTRLRAQVTDDVSVDRLRDAIGWDVAALLADPAADASRPAAGSNPYA